MKRFKLKWMYLEKPSRDNMQESPKPVTVTVNMHIPVLPLRSVALKYTTLSPSSNVEPDCMLAVAVKSTSELSVTLAVSKVTFAVDKPSSKLLVTFSGHVKTGFSSSKRKGSHRIML